MHRLLLFASVLGLPVILANGQGPADPRKSSRQVNEKSPLQVAHRFVRLESGLQPGEWGQLSDFFVRTPKPQWNKVHIVDVVDMSVETKTNSSHVYISTNSLGDLDSSLRLSNYPPMRLPRVTPSLSACYGDDYFEFSLALSDKRSELGGGGVVPQAARPLAWRVEDTSFEPLITLETAMRYVSEVREKTSDARVKKNGASTLRILNYYKRDEPLPNELASLASGGCG